jgi:hypothetical protein
MPIVRRSTVKMKGEQNIDGNCIVLDSLFAVLMNLDHELVIRWVEVLQVGVPRNWGPCVVALLALPQR